MKRNYQKLSSICVLLTMTLSFTACASNSATSATQSNNSSTTVIAETKSNHPTIRIEDIAWNIDEGIVNNERFVLLDYTNNSNFTISSFEMTFTEKNNITEDEKTSFYNDIKSIYDLNDEDLEEIKNQTISMHTESKNVVEPSESVTNVHCYYFSGIFYLKDINHYNLLQPDIATIKYLDDDKIYTVYYDFSSKKYTFENQTETAYNWSQNEIGNTIPKPNVKVIENKADYEDTFMFDAYGFSFEDFNAYVEECKALGYTVDEISSDVHYYADSENGYNISLDYKEEDCVLSGTVRIIEN